MGSFVFSNKPLKQPQKTKSLLLSKGHKEVFEKSEDGIDLLYANKVLIDNNNFYQSGCNFILGIGTYLYKGEYGIKALGQILQDFSLEMATKDHPIYGHYAFVIKKDGKVYIFGDNNGVIRLYYYEKEGQIIVSNSEIAGVVCNMEAPKIDKSRLSAFLAGKLCSEIPFVEGVHFLDHRKVIIIDSEDEGGKIVFEDKVFPEIPRIESFDKALELCLSLFKEQMENLRAFNKFKFSVELTGGLDSRLVSANINASGFNFDFVNYGLYGADSEIAEIVSTGMNKNLVMIDDPKDLDFERETGEFDLGFNFFRHYPSKRWCIPNSIQFSGLYGECLSYPEIFDKEEYRKNTSLRDIIQRISLSDIMPAECKNNTIKLLLDYFNKYGITSNDNLSEIEQDQLTRHVCGLLTHDYMYISACNVFMYFYSIYNEWHFSHFISNIAFSVRDCRRLSIALIKSIDKEVASYPFVSRLRTRRKSVNEVTELPAVYKSYNWYKEHLPKAFVNFIYGRVGRTFPKCYAAQIDYNYYENLIDIKKLQRYPNIYYVVLQRLYSVDIIRKALDITI